MSVVLLFAIVVVSVGAVVFVSGRRPGLLLLALAGGAPLAELWSSSLAELMQQLHVTIAQVPHQIVTTVLLCFLPCLVLLWSGPTQRRMGVRIGSALLVGLVAAAFLVQPFGLYITMNGGEALTTYKLLSQWSPYVISGGIGVGVIDLLLPQAANATRAKKSKH